MAWGCFAQKWGGVADPKYRFLRPGVTSDEDVCRGPSERFYVLLRNSQTVKAARRASMVRIARCAVLGIAVVSVSEDHHAIVGIYIYI